MSAFDKNQGKGEETGQQSEKPAFGQFDKEQGGQQEQGGQSGQQPQFNQKGEPIDQAGQQEQSQDEQQR